MAEGLAKQIFPEAQVRSAGSLPGKLNPNAVKVMNEIGLDISKQYAKSFEQVLLEPKFMESLDYVVTLCAEEVCPIVEVGKRIHWPIPDPATDQPLGDEEILRRFRVARDSLRDWLLKFKLENEPN